MKKLIPILSLILATAAAAVAVIGLILSCAAVKAPSLAIVAVPTAIASGCACAFFAIFAFMFRKDVLCRVSFFIDIGGVAVTIASIVIWLCAL